MPEADHSEGFARGGDANGKFRLRDDSLVEDRLVAICLTVVSRGHENPWERVEVCDRIGLRETIRSLRYLPAGKRMGKMMQKARDDSESVDSLSGKNPPLRLRQFMQRSRWRSTGTGDHQVA